jgi:hypothetical protein
MKVVDCALTTQAAERLHDIASVDGYLVIWTVTTGTKDFGTAFVARPLCVGYGGAHHMMSCHLMAPTLEALRERLPPGLTRMDRQPGDDAVIVEVWL